MKTYDAVARAVFQRPWAILPGTLATIVALLRGRMAGEHLEDIEIAARLEAAALSAGPRSGTQRTGAVAVIPLYGVIAPRAGMMSEMSGGTSVERFRTNFRDALGDDRVGAILIDCDSPGGAVDAVPEMADEIRAARGQKPVVAISNTTMASAAYWLCSAAQEVWASPSAMVGSIGVIAAHTDLSKADEMAGEKVTLISAGKYKTEGNMYEPLSDEARAAIQADVDQFYGMFTGAVAKSRGVPVATVRDSYGQGRVLSARDAKAAGMIDAVGTFDAALVQAARLALGPGGSGTGASGGYRLVGIGAEASTPQVFAALEEVLEPGAAQEPAVAADMPVDDTEATIEGDSDAGANDGDAEAELELERAKADADATRARVTSRPIS